MKERVTVTLGSQVLRRVDATIDGIQVKSRSHAIELLLTKALSGETVEQAVLLAGGSKEAAKNALKEIDGQPVIVHNIQLLVSAGVQHIIIITSDADLLRPVLGDGEKFDCHLQYIVETSPLGTAGCLHLAKSYLTSTFIVANADERKEVNIQDMFLFHKNHGGLCTMALTTVEDPSKYGVALLNGNRIIAFVEKPDRQHAPSNLISAGLYIIQPEVIALIPHGYGRMEYDVFPKLASQDKLFGYHFPGEFKQ